MKKLVSTLLIIILLFAYIPAFAAADDSLGKVQLSAECTKLTEVTVSWNSVKGVSAYDVYKKVNGKWKWLDATKSTSFVDSSVSPNNTYTYTVCAYKKVDGKKIKGDWNTKGISCSTVLPEVSEFTTTNTGLNKITLSWNSIKAASAYDIYKKINGKWKWIDSAKGNSFVDSSASLGGTYQYAIRAYAKVNDKKIKGEWTSGAKCYSGFPEVSGITAKNTAIQQITLSWDASNFGGSYDIYKKVNGKWKWIKSTKKTSYVDSSAALDTTHQYTVRAYTKIDGKKISGDWNTKGASCYSDFAAVSSIKATNANIHNITLEWSAVKGASAYDVYVKKSGGSWKWLEATSGTKLILFDVSLGNTYTYTVRPYTKINGKKVVGNWNSKGVVVNYNLEGMSYSSSLTAPKLTSATVKGDERIVVKWDAVKGASGYYVYRKTANGLWTYVQSVSGTAFTDMKAERDVQYYYTARPYKKSGSSVAVGSWDKKGISARVPYKSHYHQGNDAWKFSRALEKRACVLASTAMLARNNGADTNPRKLYNANGKVSSMDFTKALKTYGMKYVPAISKKSSYYGGYSEAGGFTYIKNPSKNAVAAIKEALDRNPEGVMCYFVKGSRMHAVVAIRYDGNNIFYSDPGRVRSKGYNVSWDNTWCRVGHRMQYKHLSFIAAID